MFLKKILRLRHTLVFRLTLLYAGLFAVSYMGVFLLSYLIIASVIQGRTDQELLNDLAEFSSILDLKGNDSVRTEMEIEAESDGVGKVFFRLMDSRGEEIGSSNMSSWQDVGIDKAVLKRIASGEPHVFETISLQKHPHKVRIVYGIIGQGKIMQIGQSLENDYRLLEILQLVFGTSIVVIILFSTIIGGSLARRAMMSIEEVTRTAMDIAKGFFERRVSLKSRGDEIDRLANAFNVMLDRIDVLVTGMREMADDMAHDLRSPITRIRGIAEMTLTTGKSVDDYKIMAANTIEECDRLLEMVNTVLDISEAGARAGKFAMEKVDIAGIVKDACELFQPIAADRNITLIFESSVTDNPFVNGEMQQLQRIVVNLLDNALKFTLAGGIVTASVNSNDGKVFISINDTGVGISRDDLPKIFKRFYRCNQSRSEPGVGLGLSLVAALVEAHGGDITATSYQAKGSKFTVTLPQYGLFK